MVMKKINTSTKYIGHYAGKWVAIEKKTERIIAAADDLQDIAPLVSGKRKDEHKITAYAFKVPRKDEGPYVL